ncbi:SDR family NAD(P)-dependent oxidoreductase [Henriciella aquimarina]|uniref:SDR family NAD(P)-dependent oxidoreductase n=1 Tax=Henriciella aquimarina TaxID=545261 RepID=UPI0009FCCF47|nr:SDR family oxidoreductase [Henriciella aquimarina]
MSFISKFDLSGKTALVTGASGGLGEHFAMLLAEQGAHVMLAARREEKLTAIAARIESLGGEATPVVMDVTKAASVENAFQAIAVPCDVIVNNSGIGQANWYQETSEEEWQSVIDTNLTGVWRIAKAATRALIDAGRPGAIVNIASVTALRPALMNGAYAASKAAVDHLTRVMAAEVSRYGIRVNALAPGYFKTAINDEFLGSEHGEKMRKRIPMKRFGTHEELDGAIMLLASDAGAYMTGETIVVDGGHLLQPL